MPPRATHLHAEWGRQRQRLGTPRVERELRNDRSYEGECPYQARARNVAWLKQRNRLVLGVRIDWGEQCKQMHQPPEANAIPHAYRPDLLLKHEWKSESFAPMVEELVKFAQAP